MAHRVISGLSWAKPCPRPACIPKSRPRGTKGLGLAYERAVGKALLREGRRPLLGQWFEFSDANGHGWCQTDLLLRSPCGGWVVLECKLTDVEQGRDQVRQLYLPVVGAALGRCLGGMVVAKHLSKATKPQSICSDLDSALAAVSLGDLPLLHWIGSGTMIPPLGKSSPGPHLFPSPAAGAALK